MIDTVVLDPERRIQHHLNSIYKPEIAAHTWEALISNLEEFKLRNAHLRENARPLSDCLTERDAILITYGDQINEPDNPPLETLAHFLEHHLGEAVSAVHILPFFPYSSDDGFSVIHYRKVDSDLGSWDDVARLGENYKLMFDAVINHVSSQSSWFQAFLREQEPYTDYFLEIDPKVDLSMVVRPRDLPLLTAVKTINGETKHVWTTFSDDQIDLNFASPKVLLEVVDLLLFYIECGASIIRLDAVAFLWKEVGTPSIHLPQTHHVVKLFRAVLDLVAPEVILITETNVPHEENISYFGDPLPGSEATDEAQMVYQFTLAPLVLHTFLTGSARILSEWVEGLEMPAPATTFFNFIASHDGIGVRPAEGYLHRDEIQSMVDRTLEHGGKVSDKINQDGTKSAYELNITLYDFLNNPENPHPEMDVARFLASQVIMLSLAGVPGIYIHSLFGTRNCHGCFEKTGRARTLNRMKFQREELESSLADDSSREKLVFTSTKHLLHQRQRLPAFHPSGSQRLLHLNEAVFSIIRTAPDSSECVLCLVNVSEKERRIEIELDKINLPSVSHWIDLIGGEIISAPGLFFSILLKGYQAMWLLPKHELD